MTFVEFQSDAHGALAKTRWGKLCSREDGDTLVNVIAAEWVVMHGNMPATKEKARDELMHRCKRRLQEKKVGFSILVIILTAALSAIIKILIEYWWEKWKKNHPPEPEPPPEVS